MNPLAVTSGAVGWSVCRSSLRIGALLCILLAACPAFAWQGETQSPLVESEQASVEIGEEPIETLAENDEAGEDWMAVVDRWFGDYLVAPMNAVLFYDFGSSRWLPDTHTGDDQDAGATIPFVVLWLLGGAVFFTLRMGFINLRGFWHAVQVTLGKYDDPNEKGEVSHFQALASALSATVGLGNIAGVAIAISTGGPGACFWIVLIGLLGMSSKFTECTLGQLYRKIEPDGTVSGGAMHYLRDGLTELGLPRLGAVLAVVFAVFCIGGSLGGGNTFQVVQSLGAVREVVPLIDRYPWIYGLILAALVGLVIVGGIRSIGAVAGRIVPLMCGMYVLASLYIIFANYEKIAPALVTIWEDAFSWRSAYGGVLGVAVIGITRAVFSNEAGVGSAAIAHAAAKTDEPVSEGIVALLEPFIDTVVVCTMTALVIIITGVYDPASYEGQYMALIEGKQGAALTSAAFAIGGYDWFTWILRATVVLFAYSTLISWSYYGERCWTWLFGQRASMSYKVLFIGFVVLGSVVSEGNIIAFSDMLILSMAFPNILGAVLLSGKVKRELNAYWGKYRRGELEPK